MGQKTHPVGFRLGILKDWKSNWYAEKDFPRFLREDETIRQYLERRLSHAAISAITIERKPSTTPPTTASRTVQCEMATASHSARPS
jgi:small subunit ribosomal protein S3